MPKNITLSVTNDGGLADPAPLIYAVSPPPLHDGDTVKTWWDSSLNANNALRRGKLIDSCPQGDTLVGMQDVQWWQFAQSFTAVAGRLFSAKFNLNPYAGGGLGTGNVRAHLYASTGVHGTSAMPTGPALATSDPVAVTTMGVGWIEFFFTGANAFNMVAGTVYCIAVDASEITGSPIGVYYWGSGTHHVGNMSGQLGANPWSAWGTGTDVPFKLYVEGNPLFKEDVVGTWPVVRLGVAGDGFNLKNVISGAGDWTLIGVFKPINPDVGLPSFIMSSELDAGPYAYYLDGANPPACSSAGRTVASSCRTYLLDGVWTVWVLVVNATASYVTLYANGGGLDSYGISAVAYTGDFNNIGGRGFDELFPANLDLAELLFCGQALPDPTVKNATQTLSNKYQLGLSGIGSVIDLATLPALKGWWKADSMETPYDPLADPALQAWWDVGAITPQADGSAVAVLPDRSGKTNDATTRGSVPVQYLNSVAGITPAPCLYFPDGSSFSLKTPLPSTQPWTLVVVCAPLTYYTFNALGCADGFYGPWVMIGGSDGTNPTNDNFNDGALTWLWNHTKAGYAFRVVTIVNRPAPADYSNGLSLGAPTSSGYGAGANPFAHINDYGSNYGRGYFKEMFFFNTALPDHNRIRLERSLIKKHGIQP
jgi:hypothetical protein